MSLDVTAETTISRPREPVAAYVVDQRNDPIWIGGISESELVGDPPIRVGSRVRRVASFLGKRIEYVNEIERLDPGALLEMRSVKSPFPMRVTYAMMRPVATEPSSGSAFRETRARSTGSRARSCAGRCIGPSRGISRDSSRSWSGDRITREARTPLVALRGQPPATPSAR